MNVLAYFSTLGLVSLAVAAEATAQSAPNVAATKTLIELARVSRAQSASLQKARACEIQLREKIAPTFCYARSKMEPAELDRLCRAFAAVAARLPKTDVSTSASCKAAIRNRAQDLAYVGNADALR